MKLFLGLVMFSIATSANASSVLDKDFQQVIAKYEAKEIAQAAVKAANEARVEFAKIKPKRKVKGK